MIKNKTTNLGILIIYLLTIAQVAKRTILSSTLEYTPWSYSELLISYPNQFLNFHIFLAQHHPIYQKLFVEIILMICMDAYH